MAQYEARPNTGVLFNNESKKAENHPDLRGSVDIDRNLLIDQLKKNTEGPVKIAIAAWKKESQNGVKFLSLSLQNRMRNQLVIQLLKRILGSNHG